MALQVFSIDRKTPSEKERLNNSVNWVDTSLLSSFKIFVGILLGPTDFKESKDKIMLLISVLSVRLMKKEFMSIWGRKSYNLFLEGFMEDWIPVATLEK